MKKLFKRLLEELAYDASCEADSSGCYDWKSYIFNSGGNLFLRFLALLLGRKTFNNLLGISK